MNSPLCTVSVSGAVYSCTKASQPNCTYCNHAPLLRLAALHAPLSFWQESPTSAKAGGITQVAPQGGRHNGTGLRWPLLSIGQVFRKLYKP
jgi:hypothetical protein